MIGLRTMARPLTSGAVVGSPVAPRGRRRNRGFLSA
jgi:hypothetical protein